MTRFLSTLGLCRRAGKIVFGFDAVCDEMKKPQSKVSGIVTAKDISAKSLKEVRFVADKYGTEVFVSEESMDDFKSVTGKRTGIIAILDNGLYKSLTEKSDT